MMTTTDKNMPQGIFALKAAELGDVVLKMGRHDLAYNAAREYLGFIQELGQRFYNPPRHVITHALDLVLEDLESTAPPSHNKSTDYQYLRDVVNMYGLKGKVAEYISRLAQLDGNRS